MKVGVISDLHGNQYAVEAVLKTAKREGVGEILILGDLVGHYYHPEMILEMLSEFKYEIIKGNHELILQDLYENRIDCAALKLKYGSGHEMALNHLTTDTLQWLFALPESKSITIDSVSFQMNHGTPWCIDEYLYPDADAAVFERCDSDMHDFVLVGHSHYAFSYRCRNSMLINCGSVGQSRQNGGLAYWTVINTANRSYEIKATPYDTSKLLEEVKLTDPQNEYASRILVR